MFSFEYFIWNIFVSIFCLNVFETFILLENFSCKPQWIFEKITQSNFPPYKLNIASIKIYIMGPGFFSQNNTWKLVLVQYKWNEHLNISRKKKLFVKIRLFLGFLLPKNTEFSFLCKLFGRLVDINMQALIGNMIQLWFVWKLFYFSKKLPKIGKFCNILLFFLVIYPLKKVLKIVNNDDDDDNNNNNDNNSTYQIITLESFIDNVIDKL